MHATIMAMVFACTGAPLLCSSRYVRLADWDCNLDESGQDIWQAQPTELYNFSHQWTNSSFAFKALQPESDITCTSLIPFDMDGKEATAVSIQLAAHGPTTYGTRVSVSLDVTGGVLLETYSSQGNNQSLVESRASINSDMRLSQDPTTVNAVARVGKTYVVAVEVTGAPVGFTFAFGDGVLATNCSIFNNTRPVAG
jgi:hypothetical protein